MIPWLRVGSSPKSLSRDDLVAGEGGEIKESMANIERKALAIPGASVPALAWTYRRRT